MSKAFTAIVAATSISMSFCLAAAAADTLPPKGADQALQAHILIVNSRAAIAKWVQTSPGERGGDNGRLRTVAKGTKIYLPIIATGFKSSASGALNLAAELEVVSPDGKATALKKCCSAIRGDPRSPGVAVLNPVIDMVFDTDDLPGTYTARVTVTDGASSATASETFLVQAGAATGKEATQQSETEPPPAPAGASNPSRLDKDARDCLRLPHNTEIIKCSEKFLRR
jgi:hypothetical protein